jgi:hypothetical protein
MMPMPAYSATVAIRNTKPIAAARQAHLLEHGQHDHEGEEAPGVPAVDLVQLPFLKAAVGSLLETPRWGSKLKPAMSFLLGDAVLLVQLVHVAGRRTR